MAPIFIQRESDIKTITHPVFGTIRYIAEDVPYVFFPDVYRACGYQPNSNTSDVSLANQTKVIREYETNPVKRQVNVLTEAGIEEFMMKGAKNKEQRRSACRWVLSKVYGHTPAAEEVTIKLSDDQINIIVERVLQRLAGAINGKA